MTDKKKSVDKKLVEEKPPELTRLDITKPSFRANGNTYFIQNIISVDRYMEFTRLGNELAFGASMEQIYKNTRAIWNALSHGNDMLNAFWEARELCYNQMNAIVNFENRDHPPVFRLCALFVNKADEDIATYDERLIQSKIDDWKKEGISYQDFFVLAGHSIQGFRVALKDQVQMNLEKLQSDIKKSRMDGQNLEDSITTTSTKTS